MLKSINKKWIVFFLIFFLFVVFRQQVYNLIVYYKSVDQRPIYSINNKSLINFINSKSDQKSQPEIRQIIQSSLSLTSEHLSFTTELSNPEPVSLYKIKKANCIGYAAFFSSISDLLLKKHNLNNEWTVKHHIGHIHFFGFDVHDWFSSKFFQDHDFVSIENKKTGEIYAVDPTAEDYLFIEFIRYKK